ncbi:MAG: hypothetical protein IJS22_03440 [Lachnospiraceae bacterium]|nr:hypothetical protein [Lachnospiraceae bacterium]
MTIIEAIHAIDELKPNEYTQGQKTRWLSQLDGMIKRELLDQYTENVSFTPYSEDTDPETVLLVGEPYEEIYLTWLESKIDYHNSEINKYNNSALRFNDIFEAYKKDYNRTHVHRGARMIYY